MKKYNCLLIPFLILFCLCGFTACGVQTLLYPGADMAMPDHRYGAEAEHVEIKAKDGVALRGWFFNRGKNTPLVVCYGGNAMNAGAFISMAQADTARSYLLMNYRGYGDSRGEPSEAALVQDACHCLQVVSKKLDKPASVALVGFSLGSGVATQVAAIHKPDALILICPFDSITEVACNFVPLVPRMLPLDTWKSASFAPQISCPVTILRAAYDSIVPRESTDALIRAFSATTPTVHEFPCDHNDIFVQAGFVETLYKHLP